MTKQTQWSNNYAKKAYKRVPAMIHKEDEERLEEARKRLGHTSTNDMILAALEQYTGLTGLRLKGKEDEKI